MEGGVPVDGGYAWVIVAAAFFNQAVVMGVCKSLGILFVALSEHYRRSASATAVFYPLVAAASLCTGPVTMALVQRFSVRRVCLTGALLTSAGLGLGFFGSSLEALIVPYGLIGGLGIGLLLTPAPLIISRYFHRRKALAMGIVFTGTGVGGILGPFVVSAILASFSLHYSILLIAAIQLHTLIGAALFRPADSWFYKSSPQQPPPTLIVPEILVNDIQVQLGDNEFPTSISRMVSIDESEDDAASAVSSSRRSVTLSASSLDLPMLFIETPRMRLRRNEGLSSPTTHRSLLSLHLPLPHKPAYKRSKYSSVCEDMPKFEASLPPILESRRQSQASFKAMVQNLSDPKEEKRAALFDWDLLREARFVLFTLGCFCGIGSFYWGFLVPAYVGSELGQGGESVARLLSIMGIGDFSGRVLVALGADHLNTRHKIFLLAATIATVGLAIAVFPLLLQFWIQVGSQPLFPPEIMDRLQVCALVVGMTCFGAFVSLSPVVLGELVNEDRLGSAWGLLLLGEGLGEILTPIAIAGLRDASESYVPGYLLVGVACVIGSLAILSTALLTPNTVIRNPPSRLPETNLIESHKVPLIQVDLE